MRPESWLESVLGSRWRVRVVRVLLRDPVRMWTEREVAKDLGASPNTVNLNVRALRDLGILEFRRLGRSNAIRLRQDLQLVDRLKDVFSSERSAEQSVREAVRKATPLGVSCILYGSTARGEAQATSDLDLLVVGSDLETAEEAATRIRKAVAAVFPVELSILSVPRSEVRKARPAPWLRNALADGELWSETPPEAVA